MNTVAHALRSKVIPNYGPHDPGDTLDEWRACVRAIIPEASNNQIDEAIRDAVRDGLMWWDGDHYRRSWGLGPASDIGRALCALDAELDPSRWPTMPQEAWAQLGAAQDAARNLRLVVESGRWDR